MFDIVTSLGPLRRSLGLLRIWQWGQRGLIAGMAIGGLTIMAAHLLWPWDFSLQTGLLCVVAGALVGVGLGVSRWPDSPEAARTADTHFALHDRLTSALEFRQAQDILYRLQRADVERRLQGLDLRQSTRGKYSWRETGIAGVALLLFAGISLLGFPQSTHARIVLSAQQQQRLHRAATTLLPAITRLLERNLPPAARAAPAWHQIRREIAQLQRTLLHAPSLAAALRAISSSQQRIAQQGQALQPVDAATFAQLNQSLRRYAARNSVGNDPASVARTLNRLAQVLRNRNGNDRAAVAHALLQAANRSPNAGAQGPLRAAARSLIGNDPQAAEALRQAARALSQTQQNRALQRQAKQAGARLGAIKRQVANRRGASRQSPGRSGQRGPHGPGQGQGSARRDARSGQAGAGGKQSTVRASEFQGLGLAPIFNARGRNGHGPGDARSPGGKGGFSPGSAASGKEGNGLQSFGTGRNATPHLGRFNRYRPVIVHYAKSARTALNRTSLPPSLEQYVRRYFTVISR